MEKTYIARQNAILLALQILVFTMIFNAMYLGVSILADFFYEFNNSTWGNVVTYDTLSYIFLMLIHAIILCGMVLRWYGTYYFLENSYFVLHSGIVFKKETRIRITHSVNVTLKQNWIGRIFQYGTVHIMDSNSQQRVTLYAVADPQKFVELFRSHS